MSNRALKYGLLVADLLALLLSFRLAYFFRYQAGLFAPEPIVPGFELHRYAIVLALGIWILLFSLLELHELPTWQEFFLGIFKPVTGWALFMLLLLAGSYLSKRYYSRLLLFIFAGVSLASLPLVRLAYLAGLRWLRRYKIGLRRVVIVGQSPLAEEFSRRIQQHPELCYELVGSLVPVGHRTAPNGAGEILGSSEEIAQGLAEQKIDELVFAIPVRHDSEVLEFIAHCQKRGMVIKLVPEYYELHTTQIQTFSLDGIPLIELKETFLSPVHRAAKVVTDYLLGSVLLVVFLPIMVAIGAALYLCWGKVASGEVRVGLGGKRFTMYRFYTSPGDEVPAGQPASWRAQFCQFLHRYSLSELPQLFSVIRGEMSLVGPRPETPERVRHYSAWHKRRLLLKPGITGLAQVKGLRGNDSSDLKTRYDLEYAANFSPLLDLTLVLATPVTLLGRRKGRVGLDRDSAGEVLHVDVHSQ